MYIKIIGFAFLGIFCKYIYRKYINDNLTNDDRWTESICKKHSKTFYKASLFYPKQVRYDIFRLYSFARISDDMIDHYSGEKQTDNYNFIYNFVSTHTFNETYHHTNKTDVIRSFTIYNDLVKDCQIPQVYTRLLIDGFKQDTEKLPIKDETDLIHYCECVASSIGYISVYIFNKHYPFPITPELLEQAKSLGIAFQLTNIARDILTDLNNDRIYIPFTWLKHNKEGLKNPYIAKIYSDIFIDYAEKYYKKALLGVYKLPKQVRFAIKSALFIYREIGMKIKQKKYLPEREYVTTTHQIKLLLQSYFNCISL